MLNELEMRFYILCATFPTIKRELRSPTSLANIGPVLADLKELTNEVHGVGKPGAARFLLSIWVGDRNMNIRLREAWHSWDEEHRAAWKAWAANPWWA